MDFSDDRIVLTREGYDDIQRELNEIMTVKRPAVIDRIREARQLGDLSENFDYQDAKHVQALLEARLKEIKTIISHSTIVDCIEKNGCIGVGSKVMVKDLSDGFEDEYTIVGPTESSPVEGRISLESCVGSALMGHKEGDMIAVRAPAGVINYQIMSVQ